MLQVAVVESCPSDLTAYWERQELLCALYKANNSGLGWENSAMPSLVTVQQTEILGICIWGWGVGKDWGRDLIPTVKEQ